MLSIYIFFVCTRNQGKDPSSQTRRSFVFWHSLEELVSLSLFQVTKFLKDVFVKGRMMSFIPFLKLTPHTHTRVCIWAPIHFRPYIYIVFLKYLLSKHLDQYGNLPQLNWNIPIICDSSVHCHVCKISEYGIFTLIIKEKTNKNQVHIRNVRGVWLRRKARWEEVFPWPNVYMVLASFAFIKQTWQCTVV